MERVVEKLAGGKKINFPNGFETPLAHHRWGPGTLAIYGACLSLWAMDLVTIEERYDGSIIVSAVETKT